MLTAHRRLVLKISPTFTGNLWLNLRRPEPALPHSLTNTDKSSTPMMLQSVSLEVSAGLDLSVCVICAHSHFTLPLVCLFANFLLFSRFFGNKIWDHWSFTISVSSHVVYLIDIFPLNTLKGKYMHGQLLSWSNHSLNVRNLEKHFCILFLFHLAFALSSNFGCSQNILLYWENRNTR